MNLLAERTSSIAIWHVSLGLVVLDLRTIVLIESHQHKDNDPQLGAHCPHSIC